MDPISNPTFERLMEGDQPIVKTTRNQGVNITAENIDLLSDFQETEQDSSNGLRGEIRAIVEGMQGPACRLSDTVGIGIANTKIIDADIDADNQSEATLYSASMHSVLQVTLKEKRSPPHKRKLKPRGKVPGFAVAKDDLSAKPSQLDQSRQVCYVASPQAQSVGDSDYGANYCELLAQAKQAALEESNVLEVQEVVNNASGYYVNIFDTTDTSAVERQELEDASTAPFPPSLEYCLTDIPVRRTSKHTCLCENGQLIRPGSDFPLVPMSNDQIKAPERTYEHHMIRSSKSVLIPQVHNPKHSQHTQTQIVVCGCDNCSIAREGRRDSMGAGGDAQGGKLSRVVNTVADRLQSPVTKCTEHRQEHAVYHMTEGRRSPHKRVTYEMGARRMAAAPDLDTINETCENTSRAPIADFIRRVGGALYSSRDQHEADKEKPNPGGQHSRGYTRIRSPVAAAKQNNQRQSTKPRSPKYEKITNKQGITDRHPPIRSSRMRGAGSTAIKEMRTPAYPPDRVDVYYFDHGNARYLRTTDTAVPTTTELVAEQTERYATRFWAELFGTLHIGFAFLTTFILQLIRFMLFSIIRPLTVGVIQLISDYGFKPLLTAIFNGIVQPPMIFLYNLTNSIRDLMEPLADGIGHFFRPVADTLRACRFVETNHITNATPNAVTMTQDDPV